MLKTGTVVDASIIATPSSTTNKDGQRDPEMHQTKKGNQWHFGMKVHIGVDAQSGLVHSVIGTAANVNDVTQASALTHGDEQVVFADWASPDFPDGLFSPLSLAQSRLGLGSLALSVCAPGCRSARCNRTRQTWRLPLSGRPCG